MPRNYKRKLGVNPRCNYDPNNLEKAVAAVKSGKLSYRKASDQFGVPRSTIENKVNSTNPGSVGRPSVFDKAEEDMLVHGILRAAHWGFPFTSDDIRYVVKGYLDKCGRKEQRFTQNLPGIEWSRAFLKRHSNVLSVRLSENIKRQRAEVTYDAVQSYFLNIEEAMRNVPPSNIINYDETNLCDDPGRKHVIVRRGTKHPERVIDSSKSSVSVMMAASGAGDLLPPYVLYKSEHLWDTWQEGGPKGTRYNRNKSGWFDLPVFEDWFFTIVLPYFRSKEGPKIMVGDNLSSHISLKVIEECERNNISYILLPPNSTHLLQPLDVGFFKPLKNAWRTVLTEWKQTTRGPISKDAFPSLLKDTLHQISTNKKENIQSAFRAVGLIPFNPDKVLSKLPDKEHGPNNSADAWSASFEEMLKTARYGRQGTTNTRRRRKLNVPPGRSISSHDLRNDGHDEPTVGDINLTESLMENRGEMNENEGAYRIVEDETMQQESEITQEEEEDRILEEEAFVLVKYPYWKGNKELNRLFVGIATEVGAKEVNVRFLRPYQNSKSVFIFPEVPDDDSVEKHQIIKVLPVPSEEKGKFIFQGNVL